MSTGHEAPGRVTAVRRVLQFALVPLLGMTVLTGCGASLQESSHSVPGAAGASATNSPRPAVPVTETAAPSSEGKDAEPTVAPEPGSARPESVEPESDGESTKAPPPADAEDDTGGGIEALGPTTAPELPVVRATLRQPATLDSGATIELTGLTTLDVKAQTPGEVSGAAVVVTVEARNGSDEPMDVDSAVVFLTADDGEIGVPTTAGPNRPFSGLVAPGESVTASYVFMLDPSARQLTVGVNYASDVPLIEFTGTLPGSR